MPISNGRSYSIHFIKKGSITVSGIVDFYAICDTTVTLAAIVTGNLSNRTFEWEQVSGPSIAWLTPLNQLIVQYSPTSTTRQDRVFRFYVDRNDPIYEQIYQLTVFSTITEPYIPPHAPRDNTNYLVGPGTLNNLGLRGDSVYASNTQGLSSNVLVIPQSGISDLTTPITGAGQDSNFFLLPLPSQAAQAIVTETINRAFALEIPPDAGPISEMMKQIIREYIVEESTDGLNWTILTSVPIPTKIPVTTGNIYRITLRYGSLGNVNTLHPSAEYVVGPPIYINISNLIFPAPVYGVETYVVGTYKLENSTIDGYDVVQRSLRIIDSTQFTELDDDIINIYSPTFSDSTIDGYDVVQRSLRIIDSTQFSELDDDQHIPRSILLDTKAVTIDNYTLVGGGTIGG